MANDNHLPLRSIYNEVMLNKDYYNDFFDFGQQKINFSFFELSLPDDDPVYTLKKVLEDLYFSGLPDTIDALYPKYNTFLSDNGHSPKYDLGDARMFVIEGIAKVRKVIESASDYDCVGVRCFFPFYRLPLETLNAALLLHFRSHTQGSSRHFRILTSGKYLCRS